MKHIAAVLLLVPCVALADDAPDYPKMKKDWEERQASYVKRFEDKRTERAATVDEKIAATKKKLAQTGVKKAKDDLTRELANLTAQRAAIAKDRYRPSYPHITEAQDGYFGKLSETTSGPPQFTVTDVVDDNNLIATWADKSWWLVVKTAGIADDDKLPIGGIIHLSGTMKYGGRTMRRVVIVP